MLLLRSFALVYEEDYGYIQKEFTTVDWYLRVVTIKAIWLIDYPISEKSKQKTSYENH